MSSVGALMVLLPLKFAESRKSFATLPTLPYRTELPYLSREANRCRPPKHAQLGTCQTVGDCPQAS